MTMRTDSMSAGGALVGKPSTTEPRGMQMAKKAAAPKSHAQVMGDAAHAALNHLGATGTQSAHVDMRSFAELQDEGPTARAPTPYASKPTGR